MHSFFFFPLILPLQLLKVFWVADIALFGCRNLKWSFTIQLSVPSSVIVKQKMHNRASKQIKTSEKNLILGRKEDKKNLVTKNPSFKIIGTQFSFLPKICFAMYVGLILSIKGAAELQRWEKWLQKQDFAWLSPNYFCWFAWKVGRLLVPNPWAASARVQQLNMSEIIFIKLTCMSTLLLTLCR